MPNKPEYKFKIDKDLEISLYLPDDVFEPTGTSSILINAVRDYVKKPGKTLDLGSGSGVVGISLFKLGLVNSTLYSSDLCQNAVDCANKNAAFYNCPIIAKKGTLFEPWNDEQFDYIVDDISGVSVEIAKISPWFKNAPCNSGVDGTALIADVLKQASNNLNPGGLLFFPIISFSNVNKIIEIANENFSYVNRLSHKEWFLPEEMKEHIPILEKLQQEGNVDFKEKFGTLIWYTDVYVAYNDTDSA